MDIVQLKYNKGLAYITLIGLLALITIINCITVTDKTGVDVANVFFISLMIYFIFNAFIPAIKNQIALELNNDGMIDFVRKRNVNWDNVKNVRQINFKNSSGIAIDLIDKDKFMRDQTFWQKLTCFLVNLSFNTPMTIALQYIEGDDKEIVVTIKKYFEEKKNSSLRR